MKTVIKRLEKVVVLALFLSSGIALGQTPGALYMCNNVSAYWNIIRYSPNYGFLNASKASGTSGFHLSLTGLSNLLDAYITDDYIVDDMEIIDDTVFFCGVYTPSVSGFLGWFDINDLFTSSGSVHIDNTLVANNVERLENIEVFRDDSGQIHVVGYGKYYPSIYRHYSAFEAVGFPILGMQYKTTDLFCNGDWDEMRDVVVTDNYVVFMESNRSPICMQHSGYGITLKAFDKNNMFLAPYFKSCFFQTIVYQTIYADGCDHLVAESNDPYHGVARMVHVERDKVAVCSYRHDWDNSTWSPNGCNMWDCGCCSGAVNYCLAHRVYDISPIQIDQPMVMTSAAVAQLPGDCSNMDCLLYDSQHGTYIVQHRLMTPGVWETAFTTLDFSAGTPMYAVADYQTTINTNTGWLPESMCLHGNGEYIVSGFGMADFSHYFWKSNINNADGNCNKHQMYPMDEKSTDVAKLEQFPMNASGAMLVFNNIFPTGIKNLEVLIKCN